MKTIWKFPLSINDSQVIEIQPNAEVIHVDRDPAGTFCFWAIVDPNEPQQPFTFHIVGTGQPIPPDTSHICSFRQDFFIWHLFA